MQLKPYEIRKSESFEKIYEFLGCGPTDAAVADKQVFGLAGTAFLSRISNLCPDILRSILEGIEAIQIENPEIWDWWWHRLDAIESCLL